MQAKKGRDERDPQDDQEGFTFGTRSKKEKTIEDTQGIEEVDDTKVVALRREERSEMKDEQKAQIDAIVDEEVEEFRTGLIQRIVASVQMNSDQASQLTRVSLYAISRVIRILLCRQGRWCKEK